MKVIFDSQIQVNNICGINNINIEHISKLLGSRIITVGNEVHLDSLDEEQIKIFQMVIEQIRKYIEEKSKCKNSECKTLKKSEKDLKFIQKGGYCLNCTIDIEHKIKTAGLWIPYEDYKIATRMIVFGKTKLEELRQSLSEVKEEYQMIGSDGKVTETWKLPKSVDEVKAEIQEMIDNGEKEIKVIENKRNEAFEKLKEKNYEHYI